MQAQDSWPPMHLHPMGVIRTPFAKPEGTPIQPVWRRMLKGR